ncbi:ras/Rap GTPase-activating protein SynGAP isoform X13 [Passer domesticus]|uniref:ras/Rap GTPase-activating protein SynGAP isoform X13 n=1 Tax=Passer domesticus TaxID=48849 RepID=UPI0030FE3E26
MDREPAARRETQQGQQPPRGQRAEAVGDRGARPAAQEALLLRAVPGRHAVRTHHQQGPHRQRLLGRALRVQQPARRAHHPPAPLQGHRQEEEEGQEQLRGHGEHPHRQRHRAALRRAVVPPEPAQRQQEQGRVPGAAGQEPLPDHEHPAHGALQGVRRVRHQQLPHALRRAGARAQRQEQGGGGLRAGAHPAEHRQGQGLPVGHGHDGGGSFHGPGASDLPGEHLGHQSHRGVSEAHRPEIPQGCHWRVHPCALRVGGELRGGPHEVLGLHPGRPPGQPAHVLRAGALQGGQLPLRVPAGAEGGVRLVAAALRRARARGHRRPPDQRLALPALPVPRRDVPQPLWPHAGVPRRADGADADPHRQGHPELGQLHQVREQGGVHGVHERVPGAGVGQHAAVPVRDLQPGHADQQHQLRGLHRPGPRAVHAARTALGGHEPAQQGGAAEAGPAAAAADGHQRGAAQPSPAAPAQPGRAAAAQGAGAARALGRPAALPRARPQQLRGSPVLHGPGAQQLHGRAAPAVAAAGEGSPRGAGAEPPAARPLLARLLHQQLGPDRARGRPRRRAGGRQERLHAGPAGRTRGQHPQPAGRAAGRGRGAGRRGPGRAAARAAVAGQRLQPGPAAPGRARARRPAAAGAALLPEPALPPGRRRAPARPRRRRRGRREGRGGRRRGGALRGRRPAAAARLQQERGAGDPSPKTHHAQPQLQRRVRAAGRRLRAQAAVAPGHAGPPPDHHRGPPAAHPAGVAGGEGGRGSLGAGGAPEAAPGQREPAGLARARLRPGPLPPALAGQGGLGGQHETAHHQAGVADAVHAEPGAAGVGAHGGLGVQHAAPVGRHRERAHRARGVQAQGVLQVHGREPAGPGVRGGDPLAEGAAAHVQPQAGGVRAAPGDAGGADQPHPPAVPAAPGAQREAAPAAAAGEGLADQEHHRQADAGGAGAAQGSLGRPRPVRGPAAAARRSAVRQVARPGPASGTGPSATGDTPGEAAFRRGCSRPGCDLGGRGGPRAAPASAPATPDHGQRLRAARPRC